MRSNFRSIARRWFFALGLMGLCSGVYADDSRFGLVEKGDGSITLQSSQGILKIGACGDRTIHVLFAPGGKLPTQPAGFAVEHEPAAGKFDVADSPAAIQLSAAQIKVSIDKATGALSFSDHQGNAFLTETAGGRVLTPTTKPSGDESVEQTFQRDTEEGLYGLGQHAPGLMDYDGATVHLQQRNTQIAIPVLVSSRGYGIFWNNPSITDVIFSKATDAHPTVTWKSECGRALDYYVFYGPQLDRVIASYRELTGAAPLLGRWGYGFWQCKQRYHSQAQLLSVASRYRQMHVPIDGLIQDWLYWYPAPWGSHEMNSTRYPDPTAMMDELHRMNVHLLISVWAKFDVESDHAKELGAIGGLYPQVIKYVYPLGRGQWYDPFNADARRVYWQQLSKSLFSKGVDGWWLDASEPELSGAWGEYRDFATAGGPGSEVFNAYPLMHTTAIYQGQRAQTNDQRVFILTRSAYAGQQRNSAVSWSGDIRGSWDVFKQQIPEAINFSLSGLPYWSSDTGGFFGGKSSDPVYAGLFTRWFQFSAFCPMFRVHSSSTDDDIEPTKKDNPGREMWQFPEQTEAVLINFDKLRAVSARSALHDLCGAIDADAI